LGQSTHHVQAWVHRRLLRCYRPQSAVSCATLWGKQAAGSLPNASRMSPQTCWWEHESKEILTWQDAEWRDIMAPSTFKCVCWAKVHQQNARMTLTIKLDRTWSCCQLANSAHPLSITDHSLDPPARVTLLSGCTLVMRHKLGSDAKGLAWQTEAEQTKCPPIDYTINNMFRQLANPTRIHMLCDQWRNNVAVLRLALTHELSTGRIPGDHWCTLTIDNCGSMVFARNTSRLNLHRVMITVRCLLSRS